MKRGICISMESAVKFAPLRPADFVNFAGRGRVCFTGQGSLFFHGAGGVSIPGTYRWANTRWRDNTGVRYTAITGCVGCFFGPTLPVQLGITKRYRELHDA